MPVLATWAPEDGVLGAVAPLALALAQPTALVIDLDPEGPAYPSPRSLKDLAASGPRADELRPSRSGLAVVRNGGVPFGEAAEVVQLLIDSLPAVVLRIPRHTGDAPAPIVPVCLLVPGRLFPPPGRGVYQRLFGALPVRVPSGSIVLPPAPRTTIAALCGGIRPPRGRWLRRWSQVWERPW